METIFTYCFVSDQRACRVHYNRNKPTERVSLSGALAQSKTTFSPLMFPFSFILVELLMTVLLVPATSQHKGTKSRINLRKFHSEI